MIKRKLTCIECGQVITAFAYMVEGVELTFATRHRCHSPMLLEIKRFVAHKDRCHPVGCVCEGILPITPPLRILPGTMSGSFG